MTYIVPGVSVAGGSVELASHAALPPFRPRFPWIGADMQTLRNSLARVRTPAAHHKAAPLTVPLYGGKYGALTVAQDHPSGGAAGKALVLCHGLGGCSNSAYMLETTCFFLGLGYSVFRINMRGSGLSKSTAPAPYSGGLTSDYRAVLSAIDPVHYRHGLYLMGFSLGGQLMVRALGETDIRVPVKAAVSVSAPLDLSTASRKLEQTRNRPYQRYLVNNMNRDLAHLLPDFEANPPRSVRDYDNRLIAPFMGFDGAEAYYHGVSCLHRLEEVSVPLMAVHSCDDPWIPAEDYSRAPWPKNTVALLTDGGGHVGFHSRGLPSPWHNHAAHNFFDCISRKNINQLSV